MANPTKAIDAILDSPRQVNSSGLMVHPLSIGRYALLEKIKSPLLTGAIDDDKQTDTLKPTDWLTTLYVMTQEQADLVSSFARGTLEMDAMTWADKLDLPSFRRIIEELYSRIAELGYIAPDVQSDDDGHQKKTHPQMAG